MGRQRCKAQRSPLLPSHTWLLFLHHQTTHTCYNNIEPHARSHSHGINEQYGIYVSE